MREGLKRTHSHANIHFYGFKMWPYGRQNRLYTKFHRSGLKGVGLRPQKSRKIAIFGINLRLWENFGGPQKKLNIGAQPETFLYA